MDDAPLVWKVPPWQAATAFLIGAVALVFVLYGHHSGEVKLLCLIIAVLSVAGGIVATRAFLVVDPQGIGWRRVRREVSVPWSDVERLAVDSAPRGNRMMLRVWRSSTGPVEIPPTLVLPTRPVGVSEVTRRLHQIARQITEYGEQFGGPGR